MYSNPPKLKIHYDSELNSVEEVLRNTYMNRIAVHSSYSVFKKALRILYKYQYYLTPGDKRVNPEWGNFIEQMDILYNGIL